MTSQIGSRDSDWEIVEAKRPGRASMVYSIRFSGDELARLRELARREHIRISDIVHRALDFYLASTKEAEVRGSIRGGSVYWSQGAARRVTSAPSYRLVA